MPARLSALNLENARPRRLVTDLLLEKVKLEEALAGHKATPQRSKITDG
jgi:hypothetical protein